MVHRLRYVLLAFVLLACLPAASAEDWYWRPYRAGYVYGLGNGTTYENAWRSDSEIDWSRITPGDTLFICGLHDNGYGDRNLVVGQSGTSTSPVTISGNCPGDPGSILSTGAKFDTASWKGTGIKGIYQRSYGGSPSQAIDSDGYLFRSSVLLSGSSPCRSFYHSAPAATFYYRPCGRKRVIYPMGPSPVILVKNRSYVTISDLDIRNAGKLVEVRDAKRVRLLRLRLQYASYYSITLNGSSSWGVISGNEISEVGNGPYAISAEGTHNDWLVQDNLIYNVYGTGDSHGIGWQAGNRNIIRGNTLHDIEGSGITFYHPGSGTTLSNNVIEDNDISNVRYLGGGGANQRGIEFTGSNCPRTADDSLNNLIQFNHLSGIEREAIYIKTARPSAPGTYSVQLIGNDIDGAADGIMWLNGSLTSPITSEPLRPELCEDTSLGVTKTQPGFRLSGNVLKNIGGAFVAPRPLNRSLQAIDHSGISARENAYYGVESFVWPSDSGACPGTWESGTGYCSVNSLSQYQALSDTEQGSVQ